MGRSYDDFRLALRMRESANTYSAVNSFGYLGAYQFGEGALIDLGFVGNDGRWWDNDYSGGWTGKLGIDSKAEFLATPAAQEAAADQWFALLWTYLDRVAADDYLGARVGGIRITASGLVAGAHLAGAGGVRDWLASNGADDAKDGYGTAISDYVAAFGGYELPFADSGARLDDLGEAFATLPAHLQARIEATYDAGGTLWIGDESAEDLTGTQGRDVLAGAGGDDRLFGGPGGDALLGGDGQDRLRGGGGRDLLLGNEGDDRLAGNRGVDTLLGGPGDDVLTGGAAQDRLIGEDGNDILRGNGGDDRLSGGDGGDALIGHRGRDVLAGGDGADVLTGGAGRDRLDGGPGDDILTGGANADVFIFADGGGHDRIEDFHGRDKIDLSGTLGIVDYDDLRSTHAQDSAAGVVITTDQGDTLTLFGIALNGLSAKDFQF